MPTHASNVLHFAVHADDLERARRFYEGVFWRFEDWGPPDFFRIHTGTPEDPGIWGALERRHAPPGEGGQRGFTCTVAVADIDATRRAIEAHGGKVTYAGEIPTVGRIVSFEDTEGNVVCAMQYLPEKLAERRPASGGRQAAVAAT